MFMNQINSLLHTVLRGNKQTKTRNRNGTNRFNVKETLCPESLKFTEFIRVCKLFNQISFGYKRSVSFIKYSK